MNGLTEYLAEVQSLRFECMMEDGYKKCRSLRHYTFPAIVFQVKNYSTVLEEKRMQAENEIFLLGGSQRSIYLNRLGEIFNSLCKAYGSITYESDEKHLLVKKDNRALAECLGYFCLTNEDVGSCDSGVIYEDLLEIIAAKAVSVNKMLLKFPPEEKKREDRPSRKVVEKSTMDTMAVPVLMLASDEVKSQMVNSLEPFLSQGHAKYLLDLLNGQGIPQKIQFIGSVKQLGEFFKRMLYNRKLLNTKKDAVSWICQHFLTSSSTTEPFNELKEDTVRYSLKPQTSLESEKRISASWMEFKTPSQIKQED